MKSARSQSALCDQQVKFTQGRINIVEKHFGELCSTFGTYACKVASLRDVADELCDVLYNYAEAEDINKSLKDGLLQFSTTLSTINDYRDAEVRRLEARVVSEISQYKDICKNAREDVKNTFTAREHEVSRQRNLSRLRERSGHNRQQISLAESELIKATAEVARTTKALEEHIDMFEKRKLRDLKSFLLTFITVELSFHAKAIELFTRAYKEVAGIDEDKDMEKFTNSLQIPESVSRLDTVKRTSLRNSFASMFTTAPPKIRRSLERLHRPPTPQLTRSVSADSVSRNSSGVESGRSVHIQDFEDEDGDDDDDDVDDDESSVLSEDGIGSKRTFVKP